VAHIMTSFVIVIAALALCLAVGIACTFYPERIQEMAVRQYAANTDPLSRLTTRVRRTKLFVWGLRAFGFMSLDMAAFMLFVLVRELIKML
jgi:hypothetical protein